MSTADLARKVVASSPTARRVVKSGRGQRVIQTGRAARVLRPRRRLLAGGVSRYRLPAGRIVHLRARSRDIDIVSEIFCRGAYAPPAELHAALAGPLRVLDCGGNVGLFALYALDRWDVARVVSFEPDPDNLRVLDATIAANEVAAWSAVPAAVSNQAGTMRFATGLCSEAHQSDDGIEVAMVDVFDHGPCDLLKMDIEGGEWPILADERLAGFARVLVLEWHAAMCPDHDPHAAALDRLAEAGYRVVCEQVSRAGCNGVLWAMAG